MRSTTHSSALAGSAFATTATTAVAAKVGATFSSEAPHVGAQVEVDHLGVEPLDGQLRLQADQRLADRRGRRGRPQQDHLRCRQRLRERPVRRNNRDRERHQDDDAPSARPRCHRVPSRARAAPA
jgi:hypothetical protein